MKIKISFFLIILNFSILNSQYTETINSNRPGSSHGAFSVGKNVLQIESGFKNSNFKNINFTIAKQNRFIEDESERKMVQAEVLVKTHIPIEFITF